MRLKPTIITVAVNTKIIGKRHMNMEKHGAPKHISSILRGTISRLFSPHFFRLGAHGCPSPKSKWKQIAGVFSTLDYPHSFLERAFF